MSEITSKKFIFKDELCDAKWVKTKLTCHKGALKFTGNNTLDFNLYRAWCNDCEKLKVVDRISFDDQVKIFVKAVDKELEK